MSKAMRLLAQRRAHLAKFDAKYKAAVLTSLKVIQVVHATASPSHGLLFDRMSRDLSDLLAELRTIQKGGRHA